MVKYCKINDLCDTSFVSSRIFCCKLITKLPLFLQSANDSFNVQENQLSYSFFYCKQKSGLGNYPMHIHWTFLGNEQQ